MAIIIGALFWQLGDTFLLVQTKLGVIFMSLFYWNYSSLISGIYEYDSDNYVFLNFLNVLGHVCAWPYICKLMIFKVWSNSPSAKCGDE